MKLALVERAWDKWRERFRAEQLRPLVSHSKIFSPFVVTIVSGACVPYSDTKNTIVSGIPHLAFKDHGRLSILRTELSSNVDFSQFPLSSSLQSAQKPNFGKNGAKQCRRPCKVEKREYTTRRNCYVRKPVLSVKIK